MVYLHIEGTFDGPSIRSMVPMLVSRGSEEHRHPYDRGVRRVVSKVMEPGGPLTELNVRGMYVQGYADDIVIHFRG